MGNWKGQEKKSQEKEKKKIFNVTSKKAEN